jgi:peptidyl-prolyl cis-trans isomerase SurA
MVANKISRFAFDWWIIQKRFLYLIIAGFFLCAMGIGAAVYVKIYGNPFKSLVEIKQPSGARFVSFEGDVRVIRAATRETIAASAETELYPGDTVPDFERAMQELKVGEISQPVRTPFGYHLIQVLERRAGDISPERRRLQARQALRERKADEALQEWLRQVRDRTYVELRLEER